PKVGDLVERIDRVEFFVTGSESEALILEGTLVKRHRPAFNVRLRDDKSYPYIGISLDEEYPRVYFTRERHRRDRLYFGPFSSARPPSETGWRRCATSWSASGPRGRRSAPSTSSASPSRTTRRTSRCSRCATACSRTASRSTWRRRGRTRPPCSSTSPWSTT